MGIAIGFLLPPLIVHSGSTESVAYELNIMFLGSAIVNTLIFVCIILCKFSNRVYDINIQSVVFSEKPVLPPSPAQARAIEESDGNFLKSLKELILNPSYMLLLITYGKFIKNVVQSSLSNVSLPNISPTGNFFKNFA